MECKQGVFSLGARSSKWQPAKGLIHKLGWGICVHLKEKIAFLCLHVIETEQSERHVCFSFSKGRELKFGLVIAEENAQLESSSSRDLKGPCLQSYQKWL